jgi:hypothetical protein
MYLVGSMAHHAATPITDARTTLEAIHARRGNPKSPAAQMTRTNQIPTSAMRS